MLLRNESKVKHSIDIKLVFDDNSVRELSIHEGEYVYITYRHDGCIFCGTGIIRKISPFLKRYCFDKVVESAVIELDMSETNCAFMEKIELDDIIDIKLVYPCGCIVPESGLNDKPITTPDCCDKMDCCDNKEHVKPQHPCRQYCKCKGPKIQYSCLVGSVVTDKGVVAHG